MTRLLEKALETARRLPPERQDDIARIVLSIAESGTGEVTAEDEKAVLRSREAVARGEIAGADEIAAVWRKHGL